jgi:hypothetical protein
MTIIGDGAAHGGAIALHHRGLRVGRLFRCPLDRAHAAHMFLQLLLGMPIGFEDRQRRLTQEVKLMPTSGLCRPPSAGRPGRR